jgi:hypothetical protein
MMRSLGMPVIALAALLLSEASLTSAGQPERSVVIEEPIPIALDGSSAEALQEADTRGSIVLADGSPSGAPNGSPAPRPIWPIVLIAASLVGMSMMAGKSR